MYNTGFPCRTKQSIMNTETPNIERILEKLRKLMDLKESATLCGEFGEANAAAAGIARVWPDFTGYSGRAEKKGPDRNRSGTIQMHAHEFYMVLRLVDYFSEV